MAQLNDWNELNFWEEEFVIIEPGECIPQIGLGWTAGCAEQIYTNGWICCEQQPTIDSDVGGGGRSRRQRYVPGITSNKAIAMREDEELLVMIEAWLVSKNNRS